MPKPIVLVTETEYRRGESAFATSPALDCRPAPSAESAFADAIATTGAEHAIVGGVMYRDRLYAALRRGSVLARFGVGHESVDKEKATDAGLLVTNTPGVLHQSVAELTMGMIGAAARHLLTLDGALRQGSWAPREGVELQGKTLAIVGCGVIGRTTARIASAGFGMRVVGYARRPVQPSELSTTYRDFEQISTDFAAVVRDADFVSLNIPGGPENVKFISRERLALCPERAWLINTARGAVVDEAALYDALAAGRLRGAALDVFEREPYHPVDPARDLRTLPQVIAVPHIGSNTADANRRMAERALRNVELGIAGRVSEMDLLNPQVLSAISRQDEGTR